MKRLVRITIVLLVVGPALLGVGLYQGHRIRRLEREGVTVYGLVVDKRTEREDRRIQRYLVVEYGPEDRTPRLEAEGSPATAPGSSPAHPARLTRRFLVPVTRYDAVSVGSPVEVRCLPSEPEFAEVDLDTAGPYAMVVLGGAMAAAGGVLALVAAARRLGRRREAQAPGGPGDRPRTGSPAVRKLEPLALAFSLAAGLAPLSFGLHRGYRVLRLEREGARVSGTVVEKYASGDSQFLSIRYGEEGRAPAGRTEAAPRETPSGAVVVQSRFQVSSAAFDAAAPGSPIEVRYLPGEPAVAEVELDLTGPGLCCAVGALGLAGAGALAWRRRNRRRKGE